MASMRVNISKSKFFAEQIEYLGYWITRKGIQPINNKVEAILNIKAPKTRKKTEIRQFIGIVKYYQLGAVIMQHKTPIAFYSRKLNTAQYSSNAVYNH
jgi:hypothetical protein